MKFLCVKLTLVVFALGCIACSVRVQSELDSETDAKTPSRIASGEINARNELIKGPVSSNGIQVILATSDLMAGKNRVGFLLTSTDGFVRNPSIVASSFYYLENSDERIVYETVVANFHDSPYGEKGLYTAEFNFDKSGLWEIEVNFLNTDYSKYHAKIKFDVKDWSNVPWVGSVAVKSNNKTVFDVEDIDQLTTGSLHDEDFYQTTVAEATINGLPTVLVIDSPAFCMTMVCGPQLEILQQLKINYKGQANFIHVDLYDNPEEIQGNLNSAIISPTAIEWGILNKQWTFIIDRQSRVMSRFEAFVTFEELEQALLKVL